MIVQVAMIVFRPRDFIIVWVIGIVRSALARYFGCLLRATKSVQVLLCCYDHVAIRA